MNRLWPKREREMTRSKGHRRSPGAIGAVSLELFREIQYCREKDRKELINVAGELREHSAYGAWSRPIYAFRPSSLACNFIAPFGLYHYRNASHRKPWGTVRSLRLDQPAHKVFAIHSDRGRDRGGKVYRRLHQNRTGHLHKGTTKILKLKFAKQKRGLSL